MKLTDISIRALKSPEQGQRFYADETIRGFGIRVSQGGAKTFVVVHGKKRSKHTIGRYPNISLKDARIAAQRILAEKTLGTYQPPSIIFERAKEKWLEACRQKNRPATVRDYQARIKHFPWGNHKIGTITKLDVSRRLEEIPTASERHHALIVIKVFFSWCASQGYLEVSPLSTLKVAVTRQSRSRILSAVELKELLGMAFSAPYPFGAIVSLLVLTGQRRGEISNLKWDYIDDEVITLPGVVTKNHREHTFPFGELTRQVLESIPDKQHECLFPASRDHVRGKATSVFNGWSKAKEEFDRTLTDVGPYTLHDLRRTFSSNLAMLGTPIHVTEKLLNHVSGEISGVAAVYNRYNYQKEMKEAIDAYDAWLQTLLDS